MEYRLRPCGDAAALIEFAGGVDPAVNDRVHALARTLDRLRPPGLLEWVPGYRTLLVEYDPLRLGWSDLSRCLAEAVRAAGAGPRSGTGRTVTIPVVYGGEAGPDLPAVAAHTGLSPEEVVRRHAAGEYRVYCLGYSPGFPYLGGLDPALAMPRLPTPRIRVPAGSVGIAGLQTGIYQGAAPGGWHLIGRTPLRLFDPDRDPPSLLMPGDTVRFEPVPAAGVV